MINRFVEEIRRERYISHLQQINPIVAQLFTRVGQLARQLAIYKLSDLLSAKYFPPPSCCELQWPPSIRMPRLIRACGQGSPMVLVKSAPAPVAVFWSAVLARSVPASIAV
jgi:hypothetical protein